MSWEELLFLAAGAAAGGFVNGLASFGTALFALGWWTEVMTPQEAVPLVLLFSAAGGIRGVWEVRGAIDYKTLARYLIPAAIGAPFGVMMLSEIDVATLKLIVGVFLVGFGVYFFARASLPKVEKPTPVADSGVGFIGGALGGLAGLSGAPAIIWTTMKPWGKAQRRALLQPFNTTILGALAIWAAIQGAFDAEMLGRVAVGLPINMVCVWLGILVFRRLSDSGFRRLVVGLMLVSGLATLIRA